MPLRSGSLISLLLLSVLGLSARAQARLPWSNRKWEGWQRREGDAVPSTQEMTSDSASDTPTRDLAEKWMVDTLSSSTPPRAFHSFERSCTPENVRSWTSRCHALAESEVKRHELAAFLTVCEVQAASSLSVPQECTSWLNREGPVAACTEWAFHLLHLITTTHPFCSRSRTPRIHYAWRADSDSLPLPFTRPLTAHSLAPLSSGPHTRHSSARSSKSARRMRNGSTPSKSRASTGTSVTCNRTG